MEVSLYRYYSELTLTSLTLLLVIVPECSISTFTTDILELTDLVRLSLVISLSSSV